MAEDRPLGAFILSIIASILILIAGVLESIAGSIVSAGGATSLGSALGGLGLLGALFGFIILILAIVMFVEPEYHLGCGIGILVLSLMSILGGAGFFLGLLLGVIGGILGIIYTPEVEELPGFGPAPTPAPWTAPSRDRPCPNCGTWVPGTTTVCPRCETRVP